MFNHLKILSFTANCNISSINKEERKNLHSRNYTFYIPVQFTPSPFQPELQTHANNPSVFVQVAAA